MPECQSFLAEMEVCWCWTTFTVTYFLLYIDLKILQSKYTAILQSFPDGFSRTLEDLQDDLTPECIFAILRDEQTS